MVQIKITPAARHASGTLTATGHALTAPEGRDLVCAAVTALVDGLAANLTDTHGITLQRRIDAERLQMRWTRTDSGDGIHEANSAAWHFFRALKQMSRAYPEALTVEWQQQRYYGGGRKHETQRRDQRSAGPAAK